MPKNVLVIGGEGYIGSKLIECLSRTHRVISLDAGWYSRGDHNEILFDTHNDIFSNTNESVVSVQGDIKTIHLSKFKNVGAIVYLAGHSSVAMCHSNEIFEDSDAFNNNVRNFENWLLQIRNSGKKIPIIYASSASVYTNARNLRDRDSIEADFDWYKTLDDFKEINKTNTWYYDCTKCMIDNLAFLHNKYYGFPIIGLRFGTVNGPAPHMRSELMLNSMTRCAIKEKKIIISQPELYRAILDIDDLCAVIEELILKSMLDYPNISGVYNLASYNVTVQELADTVRGRIGNDVKFEYREFDIPSVYSFTLNTDKIMNMLEYTKFRGTAISTVYSLSQISEKQYYTNRNEPRSYPWTKGTH